MILLKLTDFVGEYQIARSISNDVILQSIIDKREKNCIRRLLGNVLGDALISYIQNPLANITSGNLIVGNQYTIVTYNAVDDFTNCGASSNTTGVVFVATNTTPNVYTNASILSVITPRYENILNSFYIECTNVSSFLQPVFADSKGLKDLLMCEIFYYWIKQTQLRNTQAGVVSQSSENATVLSAASAIRLGEQKWNTDGLDTWLAIQWYCRFNLPDIYPDYNGVNETPRYAL